MQGPDQPNLKTENETQSEMKHIKSKRINPWRQNRLPIAVNSLVMLWLGAGVAHAGDPSAQVPPVVQTPAIPLSTPPQDLKNENGKHELDLVDPFQRRSAKPTEEQTQEELSATSLGEISEEFSILAIIIPEDETSAPMALIRLQDESNPQVVKKDDLVQIRRRPEDRRSRTRARSAKDDENSFEQSALNALESYSFYLQIREIHPTHIEAFQKKSPNESIILR